MRQCPVCSYNQTPLPQEVTGKVPKEIIFGRAFYSSHLCWPGAETWCWTQFLTAHNLVVAQPPRYSDTSSFTVKILNSAQRSGLPGPLQPREAYSCTSGYQEAFRLPPVPTRGRDLILHSTHTSGSSNPPPSQLPGSQDHRKDRLHSETGKPDNTRDNQMARGNHKNISNRNQFDLATSEHSSFTTASPRSKHTLKTTFRSKLSFHEDD